MRFWSIESGRLREFQEKRKALGAMRKLPALRAESPVRRMSGGLNGRGGDVMVIPLRGVMMRSPDAIDRWLGATSTDEVTKAVKAAMTDKSVASIVLQVDSPGGEVDGVYELARAVRSAAASKRVIGAVDGLAGSAAYYAISGASQIVARHADLVGSIGTILVLYDYHKAADKAGIKAIPIATGEFKATGTFGTELTKSQQEYLQGLVDGYFSDFRLAVTMGRKMSLSQFAAVSDGRVFRAGEAKRLGLIDGIVRDIDEVISSATPAGQLAAFKSQWAINTMKRRLQQSKTGSALNFYGRVDAADPPGRLPTSHDLIRRRRDSKIAGKRGK